MIPKMDAQKLRLRSAYRNARNSAEAAEAVTEWLALFFDVDDELPLIDLVFAAEDAVAWAAEHDPCNPRRNPMALDLVAAQAAQDLGLDD